MTTRHRLAVCACLAVALVSCGSDEPTDEEAVEAITEQLEDADGGALDVEDDQVDCIATNAVDLLGTERVIELSDETGFGDDLVLPDDEARDLADAFFDCVSFAELINDAVASDPTAEDIPQAFLDCIVDNIDEDAARDGLAQEFTGGGGSANALGEELGAEAATVCIDTLTPEQLDDLANS